MRGSEGSEEREGGGVEERERKKESEGGRASMHGFERVKE